MSGALASDRQNGPDKRLSGFHEWKESATPAEISVITGGSDKPYVFGLATALVSEGLRIDVVGTDENYSPELGARHKLNFIKLPNSKRLNDSTLGKVLRVLGYYSRLVYYSSMAKPKLFHILWNNKFQIIDRTLLMLFYKLCRKKIAITVHNVNAAKRDSNDSFLNRLTLRIQYHLADHAFVHTEKMKSELHHDFGVPQSSITVIPFGINNSVPVTQLTAEQAKERLGIEGGERTILFFGRIRPYKGLEQLVYAFQHLLKKSSQYRLMIVGNTLKETEAYFEDIRSWISRNLPCNRVIQKIEFIPDEETEVYFKAADLLVLPYKQIFQSGVLFLGYNFGLPVVATDVGSFREEILEGRTGFICKCFDVQDLAKTIQAYFESDLFKNLATRRQDIRNYANAQYSWDMVGQITLNVYAQLLGRKNHESAGIDSHSCIQRAAMDR